MANDQATRNGPSHSVQLRYKLPEYEQLLKEAQADERSLADYIKRMANRGRRK